MTLILSFISQKGGVGKSTLARLVARQYAAAEKSIRGDMIRSIVLSILMLQALFFLVYRDPFSFVRAVLPVLVGIVVAFGIYYSWGVGTTWLLVPAAGVVAALLAMTSLYWLEGQPALNAGVHLLVATLMVVPILVLYQGRTDFTR